MHIDPISSALSHPFAQSVRAARDAQASAAGLGGSVPSSPPPEVFSAMLTAARAADRLAESGQAVRFSTDPATGLSVQLTSLDGTVLDTLAPSSVLSIAAGGDPD